jgi:hypothetical protein
MRSRLLHRLMLAFLAAAAGSHAGAQTGTECFDAEVSATMLRQTPTAFPQCEDCIIMRWPWIVDLNVLRVHRGSAPLGRLMVLTVQHAEYRTDTGAARLFLRRNELGTYNAVHPREERLSRCSAGSPPANSFISPAAGQTLADLRRESERSWGARYRSPDD